MFRNWLLALALCCAPCLVLADETYTMNHHRTGSFTDYDRLNGSVTVYPGGSAGSAQYQVLWGKEGTTLAVQNNRSLGPTAAAYSVSFSTNWTLLFGLYGASNVTYILKVTRTKTGEPTEERVFRYHFNIGADLGLADPPLPPDTYTTSAAAYFNGECPPRTLSFRLMLLATVRTQATVTFHLDGTQKQAWTIQAPMYGGSGNWTFNTGPWTTASGSFGYSWKVNGETVLSGSYDCNDEILGGLVIGTGDWIQPPGTPDPTNPPPPGSDPPAVGPYEPPTGPDVPTTPTPPPANPYTPTGPVSTQEEMYAAVRKALEDAGNNDMVLGTPDRSPPSMQEDLEKRGKLDDIQGELDAAVTHIGEAKTGLRAKVTQIGGLLDLPSVGQAQSVTYGTVTIGGHTASIVVDFAGQFSGAINLLRQIVLFAASVVFVIACAKEIQKGI